MLDDGQLEQLLSMNGLCDADRLAELKQAAQAEERTLYDLVIERGAVPEDHLVQLLAPILGVSGVLLSDFQGDAMLMSLAPLDLLREEGMLPIAIQEVAGKRSLLVAMADPANGRGLKALSRYTALPLVALLAGPLDLLSAIDRCAHNFGDSDDDEVLEPAQMVDDEEFLGNNLRFTRDSEMLLSGDRLVIDEMMGGFGGGLGVASALSIIDEIPRDRHDAATPPGGSPQVQEAAAPQPPPTPASRDPFAGLTFTPLPSASPAPPTTESAGRPVDFSDLFPAVGSLPAPSLGDQDSLLGAKSGPSAGNGLEPPPSSSATGMGRPTKPASGSFMRVPRNEANKGTVTADIPSLDRLASEPGLVLALLRLMVRRGLISQTEIHAEIERLRNGG
jgi:hypothetical protein